MSMNTFVLVMVATTFATAACRNETTPTGEELGAEENIGAFSPMSQPGTTQSGGKALKVSKISDGKSLPEDSADQLTFDSAAGKIEILGLLPKIELQQVRKIEISESDLLSLQFITESENLQDPISFDCHQFDGRTCAEIIKISSDGLLEWQTGYDDAGSYLLSISAHSGALNSTKVLDVQINNTNRPPVITLNPLPEPYGLYGVGDTVAISFSAFDPDGLVSVSLFFSISAGACSDPLESSWNLIDDQLTGSDSSANWTIPNSGLHYICARVTDGLTTVSVTAVGAILAIPESKSLWLRADLGVTSIDGAVSNWQDHSGENNHATQLTTENRPLLIPDTLNGLPAVKFDGIDDYLLDPHSYNAQTVFIAVLLDSTAQESSDLAGFWGSYSDNIHIAIDARKTPLEFSFDGQGAGRGQYSIGMQPLSGAFIAGGGTQSLTKDQLQILSVEFQTLTLLNEQAIGSLSSSASLSSHRFGGSLFEILVYDRVLSAEEISSVQFYLTQKWDDEVSNDPPDEPSNLTGVTLGGSRYKLIWNSSGTTTGFRIAYQPGGMAPATCQTGTQIAINGTENPNTFVIESLSPSTQYAFRICSVNSNSIPGSYSSGMTISGTTAADDPEPPSTGLQLWLDASALVDTNADSTINSWSDKSPNSHGAFQAVPGSRPKLIPSSLAGHPVIHFDGIDDYLIGNDTYTAKTGFIVFRVSSVDQSTSELAQLWGQYDGQGHIAPDPRSGAVQRGFSFDGSSVNQAIFALDGNDYSVGSFEDSGSDQWTYDSFRLVSVEFSADLDITEHCIGFLCANFSVGSHHFGGDIAEILIYDSALSASDKTAAESYLTSKWGL